MPEIYSHCLYNFKGSFENTHSQNQLKTKYFALPKRLCFGFCWVFCCFCLFLFQCFILGFVLKIIPPYITSAIPRFQAAPRSIIFAAQPPYTCICIWPAKTLQIPATNQFLSFRSHFAHLISACKTLLLLNNRYLHWYKHTSKDSHLFCMGQPPVPGKDKDSRLQLFWNITQEKVLCALCVRSHLLHRHRQN